MEKHEYEIKECIKVIEKQNSEIKELKETINTLQDQINFNNKAWEQAKDLIARKNKSIDDLLLIKECAEGKLEACERQLDLFHTKYRDLEEKKQS